MKAEELDKIFDEGKEDIIPYLDLKSAKKIHQRSKRINLDLPQWMLESLDEEARKIGVSRQAIVKLWLSEKLGNKSA